MLLIASLLVFAGCDSADSGGGDTLLLTKEMSKDASGKPIRFSFSSSDLTPGILQDVFCDCDLDVFPFLTVQGFTKEDILSVHVTAAELVMLFPINEGFNFLNGAILKLEGQKNTVTEIANQSIFPDDREVPLLILPNRDVAGFFTRPTFSTILQIDSVPLQDDETYEIGLVLTVQIEVTGI